MVRGPKKHYKRINAPKHWMLDKLGGIFVRRDSVWDSVYGMFACYSSGDGAIQPCTVAQSQQQPSHFAAVACL